MHMRKLLFFTSAFLIVFNTCAQTLIATSSDEYATVHHNQRKIVRDHFGNIYVVFTDRVASDYLIKGVVYDGVIGEWGDSFVITEGFGPTLAIEDSPGCKIHLIYEVLDSVRKIKHLSSLNFLNWNTEQIISDTNRFSRLPVADVDSAGTLNIFWIQSNTDSTEALVYASVIDDSLARRDSIVSKFNMSDVAIANHLQYVDNKLLFAIGFQDSVLFFKSDDGMENFYEIYSSKGSQPGITYNSWEDTIYVSDYKLLYIDEDQHLRETCHSGSQTTLLQIGPVNYYCVDDVAPHIGYSFIFLTEFSQSLHHAFSYGWDYGCYIMDTVYGDYGLMLPSVAYKHFNFEFVDFIWMEESSSSGYEIKHKRDEKHIWTSIHEDKEKGKGFSITGFPNPFSETINVNVSLDGDHGTPVIEIYNSKSVLIKRLKINRETEKQYYASWDGTNESLDQVEEGLYIILCTVGDKKTARKILFHP